MTIRWEKEKITLLKTAQEMARLGLVAGASGNASVRLKSKENPELLAITPFQKPYADMTVRDIVVVDFEGEPIENDLVPSSETLLHVAVYRARPDILAVLHTHSLFATVTAVAGLTIPPIVDELVVKVGGEIPVTEYAFPSTPDLSQKAAEAMSERNAVLLRNHGMVGAGRSLQEALDVCVSVERAAQVFVYASLLGKVTQIPPNIVEIEEALFQMRRRSYTEGGKE